MSNLVLLDPSCFGSRNLLAIERCAMWEEGVAAAGYTPISLPALSARGGLADACVSWGMHNQEIWQTLCMRHYITCLGFLGNRLANFYVGVAGINGQGGMVRMMSGRGRQFYPDLQPLRPQVSFHRNVLMFGQVPSDTSLAAFGPEEERGAAYAKWVSEFCSTMHRQGRAFGFLPHPAAPTEAAALTPAHAMVFDSKEDALNWADVAVAYSSNALVEAACAGLPVIPMNPISLTWSIRSTLDNECRPSMGDRMIWMDRVASCQWSEHEIRSGIAWRRLSELTSLHSVQIP